MKLEHNNFSKLFRDVVNPDERKSRGNLYVFLVCLAISIFIWFLVALSKESYTSLEYPVQFINPPADMVIVNQPDSVLTFRISSAGFEYLTLRYLNRRKPIQVDLSRINLEEKNGFFMGSFITSRLTAEIRKQYNFSEELISISPELIEFKFEPLSGKKVPIVSNMKLEFLRQFRLSDTIVFTPSEVKVVGPRNLIDQIHQISTAPEIISNIEGPITAIVKLEKPYANDLLSLVPEEVEFNLMAERFTESTIEVSVSSFDGDAIVKTFPEKVKITFLVSLSNFKRIDPELFNAVIKIPAQTGGKEKALVMLNRLPEFVEVTKIEPAEVDFLVLKQ